MSAAPGRVENVVPQTKERKKAKKRVKLQQWTPEHMARALEEAETLYQEGHSDVPREEAARKCIPFVFEALRRSFSLGS